MKIEERKYALPNGEIAIIKSAGADDALKVKLSIEVFTCGDYFSLSLMQPGKNPALARELIAAFRESGITCELRGEEEFQLPDFILPE